MQYQQCKKKNYAILPQTKYYAKERKMMIKNRNLDEIDSIASPQYGKKPQTQEILVLTQMTQAPILHNM